MSTSPFMDDYSSEDYSDHDDDYCFVPTATSPPQVQVQVRAPVEIRSNELQNLIIDQQEVVIESVYFDVLPPELGVETAEEGGGGMEQSIYLAVESYFDLEAQAETGAGAAAHEAETAVEELAVGSYFDLEAQAETGAAATALGAVTVWEEEGDGIESESNSETVEADSEVEFETVERMIEEFIYEALQSESGLEAEDTIEEPNLDVEHEADVVAPEAENAVEEGDVIGESIYEVVESDHDLDAEAEDMVDEEEMVEGEDDMVEEEDDFVEEEDDMVEGEDDVVEEEDDVVEEEDDVVEEEDDMVEQEGHMVEKEDDFVGEEHGVIDEPLELDNNLQAKAEALVEEGAAMEESTFEQLESNIDLQAEDPEALAEPVVSIGMTTSKAQEPDSDLEPEEPEDLIDEQSDFVEEESDRSDEEWDSDAEESDTEPENSDMGSANDSDQTEEEEDDVVVSYLKSSTTIRSKARNFWVPASALTWAKLPVTDTTTFEDSSLQESFLLGCSPMLVLQECGNAVMNVIGTLLGELLRIRNDLRRVLRALFRKRETPKHA